MDEHLAETQEKDVCESQGDTYTYVPSYTSTAFLGRKRDSHDGKDECGERQGEAGILLDEGKLHVRVSSHLLDIYKFVKLLVSERLHCILGKVEVLDGQCNCGIYLPAAAHAVSQVIVVLPDEIFLELP